jgi:DNA-directed RNA polymerase subunit RPC12/RpoP
MATIYCMNCGTELDSGARFCSVCGSPTLLGAGLAEADGKAQVSCPSCGTLNDSDTVRCVACGAPLRKAAKTTLDTLPATHYPRYEEPAAGTEEARSHTLVIGAVAGALLMLALVGGLFVTGVLGGRHSEPKVTSPAIEQGEPSESEDVATEELTPAGTEIRESLEAYSWEELAIIGKEMSRCTSRDAALDIAKAYNLVDSAGNMTLATKDATLAGVARPTSSTPSRSRRSRYSLASLA